MINHLAIVTDLLARADVAGIDLHDEHDFPSKLRECESCGEITATTVEVLPDGCLCTYYFCTECADNNSEPNWG